MLQKIAGGGRALFSALLLPLLLSLLLLPPLQMLPLVLLPPTCMVLLIDIYVLINMPNLMC